MALGGIAQLIDHLDRGVHCGIKTDGVIAAGDVVINRAGQTDAGNPLCSHVFATAERAIATDDDQRVDAQLPAAVGRLLLPLKRLEFKAARSVQHRAAAMDDLRNTADIHFLDITIDQAIITAINPHHLDAVIECCAGYRANRGIHSGGVTPTGQNTNGP